MNAMILDQIYNLKEIKNPLKLRDLPIPIPKDNELLLKIKTCGVCHTELDEIEGRTPPPCFPIILGHQIVGIVESCGTKVSQFQTGDRVGVGWIYSSCGTCKFCENNKENLCKDFKATGRDAYGGYAEYMVVPEESAYKIPTLFSDSDPSCFAIGSSSICNFDGSSAVSAFCSSTVCSTAFNISSVSNAFRAPLLCFFFCCLVGNPILRPKFYYFLGN